MKLKDYIEQKIGLSKEYENITYPEDVQRIINIMKARNIEVTPSEVDDIWRMYSEDYCAQWLYLPDEDNEIFEIIIKYATRMYGIEEGE